MIEGGSYTVSPAESFAAVALLSLLGESIFSFQKGVWALSTKVFKAISSSLNPSKILPQEKATCARPDKAGLNKQLGSKMLFLALFFLH